MDDLPERPPNLPAVMSVEDVSGLPLALQIFFDDRLFERCKAVAHYIAKAEGVTPRHLIGKPEACFAVVSRALTWRLDPYAVAQNTYQTPGGAIGYSGALCRAALENSGQIEGGVKTAYYGDWSKVQGRFAWQTSQKGGKFPVRAWKDEDEEGLGITVSARLRGEDAPRSMDLDMKRAQPRNSTLWATDPRTQLMYTAIRRFANSEVSHLFIGVPFDREPVVTTPSIPAPPEMTGIGAVSLSGGTLSGDIIPPAPKGNAGLKAKLSPEQRQQARETIQSGEDVPEATKPEIDGKTSTGSSEPESGQPGLELGVENGSDPFEQQEDHDEYDQYADDEPPPEEPPYLNEDGLPYLSNEALMAQAWKQAEQGTPKLNEWQQMLAPHEWVRVRDKVLSEVLPRAQQVDRDAADADDKRTDPTRGRGTDRRRR
jgi:hypothetical protein